MPSRTSTQMPPHVPICITICTPVHVWTRCGATQSLSTSLILMALHIWLYEQTLFRVSRQLSVCHVYREPPGQWPPRGQGRHVTPSPSIPAHMSMHMLVHMSIDMSIYMPTKDLCTCLQLVCAPVCSHSDRHIEHSSVHIRVWPPLDTHERTLS